MIYDAITEADRFIAKAQDVILAREAYKNGDWTAKPINKNAAMKRASMDLTRLLAQLRRGRP